MQLPVKPNTRRLLAIACIAAIVLTAIITGVGPHPANDLLLADLVLLGPLFGTVISIPVPEADALELRSTPVVSIRSPRAPPTA